MKLKESEEKSKPKTCNRQFRAIIGLVSHQRTHQYTRIYSRHNDGLSHTEVRVDSIAFRHFRCLVVLKILRHQTRFTLCQIKQLRKINNKRRNFVISIFDPKTPRIPERSMRKKQRNWKLLNRGVWEEYECKSSCF